MTATPDSDLIPDFFGNIWGVHIHSTGPTIVIKTDADVANLETAEDKLERAVHQLEDAVLLAYGLAADDDDDDDDEPGPHARLEAELTDLVEELHGALDCVQLALGRPYVWLLSRSA